MTVHRDYLRIAMGVVVTVILGGFVVPFIRMLPTPAMMGVMLAPIYTTCAYLTLESVRIKHALLLFAALLGLILSMFMPYIFIVTLLPAVFANLVFRKPSSRAVTFAALQFNLMLPLVMPIGTPNFLFFSILGFVVSVVLALSGLCFAKRIKSRVLKKGIGRNKLKQ